MVEHVLARILRIAAHEPDRVAIVSLDSSSNETSESMTYGDLDRGSQHVASALIAYGCVGRTVLSSVEDAKRFVCLFLGALRAGAIPVPLYAAGSPRKKVLQNAVVKDAGPVLLVHGGQPQDVSVEQVCVDKLLSHEFCELPAVPQTVREDSLAYLQYSSGSTGTPKGIMVTARNIATNVLAIAHAVGISQRSVMVNWMPLFHDFGLVFGLLTPLAEGARVISIRPQDVGRDPAVWLKALSDQRGTVTGAPDFVFRACTHGISQDLLQSLDLSCLEVAVASAEPNHQSTLEEFERRFAEVGLAPGALRPSYGLAEATLVVTSDPAGPYQNGRRWRVSGRDETELRNGVVSCGRAALWTELRIRSGNRDLPDGEIGEVYVSSPGVTAGYFNRPQDTADAFLELEGEVWLRTGDEGFLSEGELFITGRVKDMIVFAGENHFAEDIEATVASLDPVLAACRVVVFGVTVGVQEHVVVACELPSRFRGRRPELAARIRQVVLKEHGLMVHEVVWPRGNQVARTTSGKPRRRETKKDYLAGKLSGKPSVHNALTQGEDIWVPVLSDLIRDIVRQNGVQVPSGFDNKATFAEIGVDSLIAMRIASEIAEIFGVSLQITKLLGAVTFDAAADEVARQIRSSLSDDDQDHVARIIEQAARETKNKNRYENAL